MGGGLNFEVEPPNPPLATPLNGKPIYDFLLVNNCNFSRTATVFEILTFKARKWLVLRTPALFDAL